MAVDERLVMSIIRAVAPTFRNAHDKVVFVIHASFMASDFDLHATGTSAFTDDALHCSSTDEVSIEHWNELGDYYGFVYSNSEKGSKKILLKCVVMNDHLLVDVLRDCDSEPAHCEINVKDYVVDEVGHVYQSMFKDFKKLVGYIDGRILSKYNGSSSLSHKESLIVPPVPYFGGDGLFAGPYSGVYPTRDDFSSGDSMFLGPNSPLFFGGVGRDLCIPDVYQDAYRGFYHPAHVLILMAHRCLWF